MRNADRVFVLPAALIFFLALLTVSAQAIRVAVKNPVESLKCD